MEIYAKKGTTYSDVADDSGGGFIVPLVPMVGKTTSKMLLHMILQLWGMVVK